MIESGFFGRHVGDIGPIRGAPRGRRHALLDVPDGQAELSIHRPHPLGIASGEVVVERQHMDAAARERLQRGRHHRGQCLAFSGLHFGYGTGIDRQRRHDLHVERTKTERPTGELSNQRKRCV